MSKLILFSNPEESVLQIIASEIFVKKNMNIGYMPSDGANPDNPKYQSFWEEYVEKNGGKLISIDNSKRGDEALVESQKINESDVLIITGGNTFQLLSHLKKSGIFETVKEFSKKDKIIVGFSAGAIIMSADIEVATIDGLDSNDVGLEDLRGFGLIDFDIYPHYVLGEYDEEIDKYTKEKGRKVKRLTDKDYLVISSK